MVFKTVSDTDFIYLSICLSIQHKNLWDFCDFQTAFLLGSIGAKEI